MPVVRRRYLVTETAEVSAALIEAEGQRALRAFTEARKAAVADTGGALTGAYGTGYLDQLREDWPA